MRTCPHCGEKTTQIGTTCPKCGKNMVVRKPTSNGSAKGNKKTLIVAFGALIAVLAVVVLFIKWHSIADYVDAEKAYKMKKTEEIMKAPGEQSKKTRRQLRQAFQKPPKSQFFLPVGKKEYCQVPPIPVTLTSDTNNRFYTPYKNPKASLQLQKDIATQFPLLDLDAIWNSPNLTAPAFDKSYVPMKPCGTAEACIGDRRFEVRVYRNENGIEHIDYGFHIGWSRSAEEIAFLFGLPYAFDPDNYSRTGKTFKNYRGEIIGTDEPLECVIREVPITLSRGVNTWTIQFCQSPSHENDWAQAWFGLKPEESENRELDY